MTIEADMLPAQVVGIVPFNHLFPTEASSLWHQQFGRGHVVLSSKWGISSGEIDTFFNSFPYVVGVTTTATFDLAGTRLSSYALSRVPKYTPTAGQAEALIGSSSERTTPVYPSTSNKFVTTLDEGLGDAIDLDAQSGIISNAAIEKYGYTGTRAHKLVKLVVDPDAASKSGNPNFYADEILPRLTILYGRAPVFGDVWYNGNRFVTFDGDAFIG
jgi:hypothetical protein